MVSFENPSLRRSLFAIFLLLFGAATAAYYRSQSATIPEPVVAPESPLRGTASVEEKGDTATAPAAAAGSAVAESASAQTDVQVQAVTTTIVPEVAPTRPSPAPVAALPASEPAPVAPVPPYTSGASIPQKIGLVLFAGLGVNYVNYDENLTDVDTKYHDLRAPSTLVGTQFQITDASWVEASYKTTPMRFDNSSVGSPDTTGSWNILSLHGITDSEAHSTKHADGSPDATFSSLYGIQYHQVPLALFKDADNSPVLREIGLMNLSLGGSYVKYLNPWTRASILGHFQYPLSSSSASSGASLTVKPVLLFDGSVGIEKHITVPLWVGLHWYGQYQQLKFDYSDSETTASGVHSTLFSNLELRLTFEF